MTRAPSQEHSPACQLPAHPDTLKFSHLLSSFSSDLPPALMHHIWADDASYSVTSQLLSRVDDMATWVLLKKEAVNSSL